MEDILSGGIYLFADSAITAIIGDSMVRGLPYVDAGTFVICRPGLRMSTLMRDLRDPGSLQVPVPMEQCEIVLLNVGTNDIWSPFEENQQWLRSVLAKLRELAPRAVLAVAAVLPRPRDINFTSARVARWNAWLASLEAKGDIMFLDSFRTFTGRKGTPKSSLFRDGLHLTSMGLQILRDRIRTFLRVVRKDKIWR